MSQKDSCKADSSSNGSFGSWARATRLYAASSVQTQMGSKHGVHSSLIDSLISQPNRFAKIRVNPKARQPEKQISSVCNPLCGRVLCMCLALCQLLLFALGLAFAGFSGARAGRMKGAAQDANVTLSRFLPIYLNI